MKTLGQIAFEAGMLELLKHGRFGSSVPTWLTISEGKRKAWEAAALASVEKWNEEVTRLTALLSGTITRCNFEYDA